MRKKVNKMKKNTLLLTGLLGIFLLSGCRNAESEIATMRGGKVTTDDFFHSAFLDPKLGQSMSTSRKQANEEALQRMIINKVFLDRYEEKVTNTMIDEKYSEQEDLYGGKEQFQQAMQASGLTKKAFQEMIKETLALETGLKEHMEIGESELDAAWDSFHPSVEAQLIQVSDEAKAKELLENLQEDPSTFDELAKENSEYKGKNEENGKITFDSTNNNIPSEVKNTAFSLDDDELSNVITVVDPSTNQTSYYIVKMIRNEGKGNDQNKYSDELTEIAQNALLNDPEFVSTTVGKELKEADVKIKDENLQDLLSDYLVKQTSESGD